MANIVQTLKDKFLPFKKKKTVALHQDYHLLNQDMPSSMREAYNSLRTNLIFLVSQAERKQIVFTSSFPGEGKTTNAMNIAILFAETGAKVLLVDADMRRPKIHRALKRKHSPGLADVLGKLKSLKNAIQTTSIKNLDVLTAGTTPPNPSELLLSDQLNVLLQEAAETYDYVFIDAPPIKSVTDAAIISTKVAGTIMIVRAGVAHKPEVCDALAAMEEAGGKVLGFILNDVTSENLSSYRYNRYYYYAEDGTRKSHASNQN